MPLLRTLISSLILAVTLLTSQLALSAQASPNREYQLKAVFLYNFTQFVEWPEQTFTSSQAPMVIGILGPDPFGNYLEEIIAGERINGHPLLIKRFKTVE